MARGYAEDSLAFYQEVSDKSGRMYALVLLEIIATVQGDLSEAAVHNGEFLTFYRQLGYKRGIGIGLTNIARCIEI
jgi:hypothetical protein